MSVQVRRRREAAAFLQNFVGAQGELLVDTTNNRVQVHDGVTPGGFPAAAIGDMAGRNALIDGNFTINQRAYASGASLAANAYAHDRWKAGANGCAYTFAQAVPDTTITITSGTLIQAVDAPNLYATAYWLTWTGTATARVWQGSATGAFSAGTKTSVGGVTVNALLVTGLTIGTIASVEFSTGTLGLVQFEATLPSAGPTRFERRHLGQELALCMRYFQRIGGTTSYKRFATCAASSSTIAYTSLIATIVPLRTAPTFSYAGTISLYNGSFFNTTLGLDQSDPLGFDLTITSSGLTSGTSYLLLANNDATARFDLSAET